MRINKIQLLILSIFPIYFSFSQDTLHLKSNEYIFSKIVKYDANLCHYELNGNLDSIKSIEVSKISFKNKNLVFFDKKLNLNNDIDAIDVKNLIKAKDYLGLYKSNFIIPNFFEINNGKVNVPKKNIDGLLSFLKYSRLHVNQKKLKFILSIDNINYNQNISDLVKKEIFSSSGNHFEEIEFVLNKVDDLNKANGLTIKFVEFDKVLFIEPNNVNIIPKIEIPKIDSFPKITNPFKGMFGKKDSTKIKNNDKILKLNDSTFFSNFNKFSFFGLLGFNYINPLFSNSWTSKDGFFSLSHGYNYGIGIEYEINKKSSLIISISKQTLKVQKTYYEENSTNESPLYFSKTKFSKLPINVGYKYYFSNIHFTPSIGILQIKSKNTYSESHPDFGLNFNEKRIGIESSLVFGYRYSLSKSFIDINLGYTRFFNFRGFQLIEQPFDTINLSFLLGIQNK